MVPDAVETTIRILVSFSGKEEDWNMWSKKFLATAQRRGYKGVITGIEQRPEYDDEDFDEVTLVKWKKINDKGYTDLLLACSDQVSFGIVDSSQINEQGDGDA